MIGVLWSAVFEVKFPCRIGPAVFFHEISCGEPSFGCITDIFDALRYIRVTVYSIAVSETNSTEPFRMFFLVSCHETFCSRIGFSYGGDGYPVIRNDILIDEECDEIGVIVG